MKPGYKTTEFWLTLSTLAVSGLVLFGVVSPADQAGMSDASSHLIESIVSIVTTAGVIYKYIHGRNTLKAGE